VSEPRDAAKVQDALYRIAELAGAARDLQEFYREVHTIVGELMYAENFFISLYDEERQLISFPYYIDEIDDDIPDPNVWDAFGEGNARGFNAYVLRTGMPQFIPHERLLELIEQGEVELVGVMTEHSSWIGAPLLDEGKAVGVLVVQSYTREHQYTEDDLDLLAFVAQHVGAALSRARAIEETRQRNAELALINSVQAALAGELELQAIYDVVGDKLRDVFDAQVVDIAIYDEPSGLFHFPYQIERGVRFPDEPMELIGFRRHVMETREPLVIPEASEEVAERYGNPLVHVGEPVKSAVFVPLVVGGRATGVISLQNVDREHAFREADERLLTTLAGSLSVALENARLVHETRQRNAELALINSVQQAIAGELEQQAIYDIVGDKIREVFDAQVVAIFMVEEATGLVVNPYAIERGERLTMEPRPSAGFSGYVLETREPVLVNEDVAGEMERRGIESQVLGEAPKAALYVPLLAGDRATGVISLQNVDREHAFTESDVRLLTTLAGSLSVALDNARLVHETRQRNAELALINSVQEAIAGELEQQAIYDIVGDKIQQIFDAQGVAIQIFDETTGLVHYPYLIERGNRLRPDPIPRGDRGFTRHVLDTAEPLMINENLDAEAERYGSFVVAGEMPKSILLVPLVTGGRATGAVLLENVDREHAFTETDKRLLLTLAGSLSVALDNARLVHETRQRNAELALINSVQAAIAGELDPQAIYDVVGDKIRDMFDAQSVAMRMLDETTGQLITPYVIERGERLEMEPTSPVGFSGYVLETREPLMINEDPTGEAARRGIELRVTVGELPKSVLFVPLLAGTHAIGVVSLQNVDREHAFTETDERLLVTLAGSLSVALDNARLVHETRQRNAELALINSVQAAIAGELDPQAIYDLVGDKIRDVFDAQAVMISMLDETTGYFVTPYAIERGERLDIEPSSPGGFTGYVLETREPLMINEDVDSESVRLGLESLITGEAPRSVLFVPLLAAGHAIGVVSLQNVDRDHAFTETDERLLVTLAGSLSVALDNARLVHETRQRNAELALINSVQESIAGELDQQAIYDLVGDRVQEVFDAQVVVISMLDEASGLLVSPYVIERGERLVIDPMAVFGFREHVLEAREPLAISDDWIAEAERYGNPPVLVGEIPKSGLFVPLFAGGRATGVISLQNVDREHAFSDADERLLVTIAGSLSVALENARLVHETRQRNAELALISSVQAAIAGELDQQAIYNIVGDKIQEVFDAQVVDIGIYDDAADLLHFPYTIERGVRQEVVQSVPLTPFRRHVLASKEPLLFNENMMALAEQWGIEIIGESSLSALWVPLAAGSSGRGWISLQNLDHEHAFSDSDVQLLSTLAGSLGVALDNARLVDETKQRNAELALINSVQDALAGELELQAIYDVVGDKIQEVFDAQVVDIAVHDESDGLIHFPYIIERGERFDDSPSQVTGFRKTLLEQQQPLLIGELTDEVQERLGMEVVTGDPAKSALWVPLVVSGKGRGWISLQNLDREHAFGESDVQLLGTLAGSLGVALENARLVHETRQRVAELAVINSVQDSIAGELDQQAIYDVVGEKLREVFDAQVVDIAVHDEAEGLLRFVYQIERGVHFPNVTFPVMGFRKHVMETREPLAIHENMNAALVTYGNPAAVAGEPSKGSAIFQPLVVGGRATGSISIQNLDHEHAFTPSDQQLLSTIAGSLGVALENAQLIHETRQRVAELGTVNSVGQALATQLNLDELIHLVGERVRETFDADIAYVALHDEAAGLIAFPYNWELGEHISEPPMPFGEGLTSQIIESGEPLLEDSSGGDRPIVGTPSKSYLGVPIWGGDRAIGVISVQSTREEGRYGEDDTRLLATLAANVGVAIQNARLFAEIGRQKEYFESLVGISPVAVIEMDADEEVTGWNPAAAALFGYEAEEALGRQVDELVFGGEAVDEGREITREALASGRAHRITRRKRKDGTPVDVELMLVPLAVEGQRVGFLGIYHDITELQQAREEAEAATQAKSAFLATMSHEIRTPMNAVIGMTGLLLGTELTPEQREFAEVVRSSGDALLHVIDDILDYSKIEAGKLELEHAPFDLRECVDSALDMVAPRAAEKSLELGCLVGDGAPAGIAGDAARLRQVLLNLLSNAVKFTEQGEVVVDLDGEPAGAGSHSVHLVVRDTGIGIRRDRMDRLFESFSQIDASTTRRYGGTGLGLAISKRLIELMGGRLWVESEEGKGSSFHIELTARDAEVPKRVALDAHQLEGKRLLVVDDNATNREIVSRQARSWGMEAVPVELPSLALELIAAGEPFDVAVLDMVMPEMDGRELAREIRRHRTVSDLPLVLVTSLGRLPQARTADEFSAQLAKPLKASQLFDALMQVLAEHQALEPAATTGAPVEASTLRILLAEDNAVNQKVALALLGKMGYQADVVWNGLEALAALERQRYDVVLMDVQMPELDGLDTSRRIRERWADGERPRIIAMTANALQEDRDACFAAGMDDYVAKPISPDALAEALHRAQPLTA
jgi:PAS domain S-box-containing protein